MRGEVKLSDFGIAKAEARMSRTEVGMIKGNVSFMSPEQARGEPVDRRSDLFSAAVVLYYCLTAQLMYGDETMFNRLVRAAIGLASGEFDQLAPCRRWRPTSCGRRWPSIPPSATRPRASSPRSRRSLHRRPRRARRPDGHAVPRAAARSALAGAFVSILMHYTVVHEDDGLFMADLSGNPDPPGGSGA